MSEKEIGKRRSWLFRVGEDWLVVVTGFILIGLIYLGMQDDEIILHFAALPLYLWV